MVSSVFTHEKHFRKKKKKKGGGGGEERERESKLVFYAQSTSVVISGR